MVIRDSSARPAFDAATVADAMHPGIVTCLPEVPMTVVARTMAAHRLHCVVVAGLEGGAREHLAWGIVSDLDLVRAAAADATEACAGQLAATPAVTVSADDPLALAAVVMSEYDVHHVVVLSPTDQRPIGVLSTLDIARVLARGRD
jgi:CBS domain-containing protein